MTAHALPLHARFVRAAQSSFLVTLAGIWLALTLTSTLPVTLTPRELVEREAFCRQQDQDRMPVLDALAIPALVLAAGAIGLAAVVRGRRSQ